MYSAELLGLPTVPPLSEIEASADCEQEEISHHDYVLVGRLPYHILGSHESQLRLVVPQFGRLVQSEMHVLLQLADQLSTWGQHMAQLSELIHSPGFERGSDSLHEIVKPTQVKFAQ